MVYSRGYTANQQNQKSKMKTNLREMRNGGVVDMLRKNSIGGAVPPAVNKQATGRSWRR